MSDSHIEIINAPVLEDNFTGVIIDGVPHLYWKEIYQKMGIKRNHAYSVLKRLEYGTHFIEYTVSEIKDIYTRVHKPCTLPTTTRYVFLTAEGYHRAIMEISTGYIIDPEVAENIESLKDKMANIYTRYQQGEVLSKATEHPVLPGDFTPEVYAPVALVLEDQLAIARIMIGEGVEPAVAKSMAFSVTEEITHCGDVLTPWRPLIQADPFLSEPALLNPKDIGIELGGMSAISINKILVKLGFQKKIGSEWVPTQIGKIYARFVPQEIQHNRGIMRHMQLKWVPGVIEKIREKMFYENKGQTGLFTGEMGI